MGDIIDFTPTVSVVSIVDSHDHGAVSNVALTTSTVSDLSIASNTGPKIPYEVVKRTAVYRSANLESRKIARLMSGERIHVVQVFCNREGKRFWGRIQDPTGWITIRTMEDGCD